MSGPGGARKGSPISSAVLAAALVVLGANHATAQQAPRIWDVPFGTHVSALPAKEFVDPACGSNGGPPKLDIGSFGQFMRCAPEPSGLREVWFIYDDEQELIARALRNDILVRRYSATTVIEQPVILSLLIDAAGRVQGYRVFTDPRAPEQLRMSAFAVANALKARFGSDAWSCVDLPPAEGETPVAGAFVKERCAKISEGRQVVVESRHYYRPGQAVLDPRTGLRMINAFESSARLEVVRADALR